MCLSRSFNFKDKGHCCRLARRFICAVGETVEKESQNVYEEKSLVGLTKDLVKYERIGIPLKITEILCSS